MVSSCCSGKNAFSYNSYITVVVDVREPGRWGWGHSGVAHPSPSWKLLALNSTVNAGLVALSDGATSVASRSRESSRKSQDV